MKKRILALMLGALLLTSCSAQKVPAAQAQSASQNTAAAQEKSSGVGFYFDTVVTLTLYGAPEGLMDELWQACSRYEQLLSRTVEGSDVYRINNAGGQTVAVDRETWTILARAKELSEKSGGAFSVTIAPMSTQWDFTGGTEKMPTEEERLAALPLVNDELLVLGDNHTVTLPAGMSIDLGGIAKGYIADRIAEMIQGKVTGATLNFGGNVYAVGSKPDGTSFNIGVSHPMSPHQAIAAIAVKDTSVVTSGTYQRYFEKDGVIYHHILDPRTGLPSRSGLSSVTVVADSSMTADALATACVVLGREDAMKLLDELGYDALFIDEDMNVFTTPGFSNRYPLQTAG